MSTPAEIDVMVRSIAEVREAGADGIVIGSIHLDGTIQYVETERLVAAAGGLPVTFHKAFDATPNAFAALDTLLELGVSRVLTSGHVERAIDGADELAALVERAGSRLVILAGGKVRGDHVRELVARTGVREVHARAEGVPGLVSALRGR